MKTLLALALFAAPLYGQHAYWRLYITRGSTSAISIAEWQFYDNTSTLIPTTGGTVTACAGTTSPANAFDANPSTFSFTNGTIPCWWQYQFASAVSPVSWTLTNRGSFPDQTPTDIQIQYSDNGSAYTAAYYFYGLAWYTSAQSTLTLSSSTAAPASIGVSWRILVTNDTAGQSTSVADLILYNASNVAYATSLYAALCSTAIQSDAGYTDSPGKAFYGLNPAGGSNNPYWASINTPTTGSPEWLGYRFASSSVYPSTFSITARVGSVTQAPHTFSLQSSTDEVTWTTLESYTAAAWTTNSQVQTFTTPTQAIILSCGAAGGSTSSGGGACAFTE